MTDLKILFGVLAAIGFGVLIVGGTVWGLS